MPQKQIKLTVDLLKRDGYMFSKMRPLGRSFKGIYVKQYMQDKLGTLEDCISLQSEIQDCVNQQSWELVQKAFQRMTRLYELDMENKIIRIPIRVDYIKADTVGTKSNRGKNSGRSKKNFESARIHTRAKIREMNGEVKQEVYDQIQSVSHFARTTRFNAQMTPQLPIVDLRAASPEERYLAPNNVVLDKRFAKSDSRQVVKTKLKSLTPDMMGVFNALSHHRKARIIDQFFKNYSAEYDLQNFKPYIHTVLYMCQEMCKHITCQNCNAAGKLQDFESCTTTYNHDSLSNWLSPIDSLGEDLYDKDALAGRYYVEKYGPLTPATSFHYDIPWGYIKNHQMETIDRDVYWLVTYKLSRRNGRICVRTFRKTYGSKYDDEFPSGDCSSEDQQNDYENENDTGNETEEGRDITVQDLQGSDEEQNQENFEMQPTGNVNRSGADLEQQGMQGLQPGQINIQEEYDNMFRNIQNEEQTMDDPLEQSELECDIAEQENLEMEYPRHNSMHQGGINIDGQPLQSAPQKAAQAQNVPDGVQRLQNNMTILQNNRIQQQFQPSFDVQYSELCDKVDHRTDKRQNKLNGKVQQPNPNQKGILADKNYIRPPNIPQPGQPSKQPVVKKKKTNRSQVNNQKFVQEFQGTTQTEFSDGLDSDQSNDENEEPLPPGPPQKQAPQQSLNSNRAGLAAKPKATKTKGKAKSYKAKHPNPRLNNQRLPQSLATDQLRGIHNSGQQIIEQSNQDNQNFWTEYDGSQGNGYQIHPNPRA